MVGEWISVLASANHLFQRVLSTARRWVTVVELGSSVGLTSRICAGRECRWTAVDRSESLKPHGVDSTDSILTVAVWIYYWTGCHPAAQGWIHVVGSETRKNRFMHQSRDAALIKGVPTELTMNLTAAICAG